MDQEEAFWESSRKIMEHSTINYQNFEEIDIKEEPLEETSQDREFYEHLLQSIKKEECINDNDKQNDKEYENPITVNKDIQETKNTNSNGFCCAKCNKSFALKANLNRHMKMKIHSGDKQYYCNICKKFYRQNGASKEKDHFLKYHSGNKELECIICKTVFAQKEDLKNHLKIHNQIQEYQCPICGKLFPQENKLILHLIIHDENQKYECSICFKLFRFKAGLVRHMNIHKRIKVFSCLTCSKTFSRKDNLKQHIKTHKYL